MAKRFAGSGLDVVVPDQRNHGRSGRSDIHTYEAMADDLLELIDSLGFDKVILLGHSMGGKTAMQFSLEQHDRVSRLIVADISPDSGGNEQHLGLIETMMAIPLQSLSSRQQAEEMLKERIKHERIRMFLLKNIFWKDKSSLGWRVNLEVIRENMHHIFRTIDHPYSFEKPVLFLRGEKSPYIADSDIPRIMELFPAATIEPIRNGTHWLHADNPGDFYAACMQFIEG